MSKPELPRNTLFEISTFEISRAPMMVLRPEFAYSVLQKFVACPAPIGGLFHVNPDSPLMGLQQENP